MGNKLFRKVLRLETNLSAASVQKSIVPKHRRRKIIPDEYFIDVITTIPERNAMMKNIDI